MKFTKTLFISILAALALSAVSCGNDNQGPVTPDTPDTPQTPTTVGNTMVVYEANPKVFASSKSLKAIEDRLGDIQDLGVNVIWLMPIQPIGSDKTSVGSPYCIKDFKAVNPSYGTIDDLKSLVKKAHSMDMKVILDWIANHTSWDNPWITEHPDWYTKDANGNIISPAGMGWNDVADLNFKSNELRTNMIDAMTYWVKEADVDGFRCDYADGVPMDFWKDALDAVKAVKADAILLAEGSEMKLLDSGFQMLYGWDFQSKLASVFSGRMDVSRLYETHKNEYKDFAKGKHRLRFTTNHDKAMSDGSPITIYKGERGAMAAFVITAYMGGIPLIYSSQEVGYSKTINFFTNVLMDWDSNPSYTEEYQKVMAAYHESAPLRGQEPVLYNTGDIASIYYKDGLFVVANTTGEKVQAKAPMERAGDKVTNMVTGASETIPAALTLEAYEYRIWKIEK